MRRMAEEPKTYAVAAGLVPTLSSGVVAISTAGLAAIAMLIGALGAPDLAVQFVLVTMFVLGGVVLGYRAVRAAVHPSPKAPLDDAIEIGAEALVLRRRGRAPVRIRRGDLASGVVVPVEAGGAFVVLRPAFGREIVAWMPWIDEARALLDAAGLSPTHKPATYSFFFDMHVTVGADGVLVRWPLLRRRVFLGHDRIDDVRWRDDRIVLVLTDGDRYEINTGPKASDAQRALLERLLEARKAYVAPDAAVQLGALARNARTAHAWVTELRAMTATGGQYRSASLPADALYRIAVDPTEKEEHRIGAALALRPMLDDDGRERLRVAAGSSASPRVRVVLSAAADEEDDETIAAAIDPRDALQGRAKP